MLIELVVLAAVGVAAGILGTVSGGASLLSFPALLALGYSPLEANTTNTVGLSFMSVGSSVGYRRELLADRQHALRLSIAAGVGGLGGGALLLWLGNDVFEAAVPLLLVVGSGLVLLQPWIVRRISGGRVSGEDGWRDRPAAALFGTLIAASYGGYFGAGLGVVLVGLYGVCFHGGIQRAIALKSVVAVGANLTAVVIFVVWAPVVYPAAVALAISSFGGGLLGARIARRLPDRTLRVLTVAIGLVGAGYAVVG